MRIKNYLLFVLIALIGFGCKKQNYAPEAKPKFSILGARSLNAAITGTAYYVSTSGNDNNNGTSPSTPWQTIAKVNSHAYNAGDGVLFNGGQTFTGNIVAGSSGSSSSYVVYASYGTGRATINAGSGTGIYVHNKSYVLVDSLIINGSFNASTQSGNTGYGVEFLNDMTGGGKLGYCKVTNCDISGFKLAGIQFLGAASDNGQCGFSQIIAIFNSVHDNAVAGISSLGGWPPPSGSTNYSFPYAYIGYNYVYNNLGYTPGTGNHTGDGIVIGDAGSGTIEHNVAYNNGWNNTNSGGGPAAIWCWDSTGINIQFNEAYNNGTGTTIDGDGFDLDGGDTYCTMQYNYSHNNYGDGYLIWEFGDTRVNNSHNTIRYNISQFDGVAIATGANANNCNNNNIYNNTCISHSTCVNVAAGNVNNNFYNNIFYCTNSGSAFVTAQAGGWFLNNDYYNSGGGFKFNFNGTTYTSLSSLRSSGTSEVYNGSNYGYNVDPSLNNPGNGGTIGNGNPNTLTNYQLNSGSSMIDNAYNLTGFGITVGSLDFNGLSIPYGNGYDIGACESHSGSGGSGIVSGATYQLISGVNNSSVADVYGSGTANGTVVNLWQNNNTNNQKWVITSVGSGYYTLSPVNSPGSMMDVSGGGTGNGTQVQIWQSNGGTNQKWLITSVGGGYYTLAPGNAPGSLLDVNGGGTGNGTKIQIWQSGGGSNQKWELVKQ